MTTQMIEIARLTTSPLNARKTETSKGIEELKASIASHGLMQNLVVTPAGKKTYHVIAGGRRLAALQGLVSEGKLPPDYAVACQIVSEKESLELSIAENTVRHAMHPADEFEAFALLVQQGHTAEEIARRFGVEEKHVLRRLKLGRVAPALLAAYRDDELGLESLMAFTVTDDHTRQMEVYHSLPGYQRDNEHAIRRCLTAEMPVATHKLALFVGLDAYTAAGGMTRTDLFGETVYLEDTALLVRLAGEKLTAAAQRLREEGWAWVEMSQDRDYGFTAKMSRLQPNLSAAPADLLEELGRAEQELEEIRARLQAMEESEEDAESFWEEESEAETRVAKITERLESHADFDPNQRSIAGCYLSVDHQGSLCVEKGLVRKEDRKHLPPGSDADAAPAAKEKPLYSKPLSEDLQTYRLQAAKLAVARSRDVALDILIFNAVRREFNGPVSSGPDVIFKANYGSSAASREVTAASNALAAIRAALPLEWLKQPDESSQFDSFRQLDLPEKLDLLAFCTATSLRPQLGATDGKCRPDAYEDALALTGLNVAAYWRPTRENYLDRVSKAQLLAIGMEIYGERWADKRRDWKKSDLADTLATAFADPDSSNAGASAKLAAETAGKLKTWLPAGMGFQTRPEEKVVSMPRRTKKPGKAA